MRFGGIIEDTVVTGTGTAVGVRALLGFRMKRGTSKHNVKMTTYSFHSIRLSG